MKIILKVMKIFLKNRLKKILVIKFNIQLMNIQIKIISKILCVIFTSKLIKDYKIMKIKMIIIMFLYDKLWV